MIITKSVMLKKDFTTKQSGCNSLLQIYLPKRQKLAGLCLRYTLPVTM